MKEFHELTALVIDAHKKAGTSAHWAAYDIAYGGDDEVVAFSGDKTLAEIDTGYAEDKQFRDALGADGRSGSANSKRPLSRNRTRSCSR